MDWITNPQIWAALVTLTVLEIVLGVDNIIFISILAGKLPPDQQPRARRLGLSLAMLTRIALLLSLSAILRLTTPLFAVFGNEISGRDVILLAGGLFLLVKSTREIHDKLEGVGGSSSARVHASFAAELPFPEDHPLYAGLLNVISAAGLKGQLSSADVVLAIGTPVLPLLFPIDESPFPETAKVIHIDLDAWEIDKNWPVDIGVLADPRMALAGLIAHLKSTLTEQQRSAAQARAT